MPSSTWRPTGRCFRSRRKRNCRARNDCSSSDIQSGMAGASTTEIIGRVQKHARVLSGAPADYDWLLDRIGDRRVVLLGEASHGTHEFYRERIRITRRLIEERGFSAVAVEADWPDAYRVNRYVRGVGEDTDAVDALAGFERFPTWMWRNADVLDFVGWLRSYNERTRSRKVGFY